MDGMILAAGLGTRLLPLTRDTPKALLDVGGATMLERTVQLLAGAGCERIVINVHHHADRILDYLRERGEGGTEAEGDRDGPFCWHDSEIVISKEDGAALETGGGLKRAAGLFHGDRTILIHNVDVISDVDLARLVAEHEASGALATLAVSRRSASRYLVFDPAGLCGRVDTRTGAEEWARKPQAPHWRAGFTGIHAVAPDLPGDLSERGAFSIIRSYLRLAAAGREILPFDVTGQRWLDLGTPERLAAARAEEPRWPETGTGSG